MTDFISGAITMGYVVAGIFLLRFWRDSRDRLFAMFGAAFFLLALQRFGLDLTRDVSERATLWYFVRLLAYLIIIAAIVDKNRKKYFRAEECFCLGVTGRFSERKFLS